MRSKSPSRRRRSVVATRPVVSSLEPRRLLASVTLASQVTVIATPAPIKATLSDPTKDKVNLSTYLLDPNVPGTIATFQTSKGNVLVALTDQATPISIANFLGYVNSGAYNNTVIHRSAFFSTTDTTGLGVGGSAANPANIIQGGGYTLTGTSFTHLPVGDGIQNFEAGTGPSAVTNVQGTIAFGNTGATNSATSEWFFNNQDNSASFDGRYTAFGHVLTGGNVVNTIGTLPTTTIGDFNTFPIQGLTANQISGGYPIGAANLVFVYGIATQPGTTYKAVSSNPSLVSPTVDDGTMSFNYGTGGATGTATVTVTGTNLYDGTSASTTFLVTVPPASSTATAPITAADTVPAAVVAQATVIHPLTNDTDAAFALNPSTVTVVTQPAHGTATADPATGDITYTSAAGFNGDDSFQYTVANSNGVASAATAVNVHVVPVPLAVTVGAGSKIRTLLFTQRDGAKGRFAITGGTAVVTFSAGDVATSVSGSTETVTGAGATIANVVAANKATLSSVSVRTVGGTGTVTLGGYTNPGPTRRFDAPNVTATGTMFLGGAVLFDLGSASHANITIGAASSSIIAKIGKAVDTSLSAGVLTSLTSQSWTNDDGGAYTVSAEAIQRLDVRGTFDNALAVTGGGGYSLTSVDVGGASAPWQVNGAVFKATVNKPTSGWSLASGSLIHNLIVRGDLLGSVSAAQIETMTVTGAMTNASVETSGLFNQSLMQLTRLSVAGAMTNSVVFSAGNIGSVTALSMAGSRIYAGVSTSIAQAAGLPAATTDLSAEATIKSVALRARTATFANSEIAAYVLNSLALGKTTASNAGTPFGVSAHTLGTIATVLDPGGRLVLSGGGAGKPLQSAAALSAYLTRKKITLSDFKITLY